jgi:hypothetical protein
MAYIPLDNLNPVITIRDEGAGRKNLDLESMTGLLDRAEQRPLCEQGKYACFVMA